MGSSPFPQPILQGADGDLDVGTALLLLPRCLVPHAIEEVLHELTSRRHRRIVHTSPQAPRRDVDVDAPLLLAQLFQALDPDTPFLQDSFHRGAMLRRARVDVEAGIDAVAELCRDFAEQVCTNFSAMHKL